MKTVLITGSNRGLGLEFCRQYCEAGWNVIACCREPDTATALLELAGLCANFRVEELDVANFDQIDRLAARLSDVKLDVLINNAGIYGDAASIGFGKINFDTWMDNFRVNSLAPIKMSEAFLPNLVRSKNPLIVSVSSLMGSISDNTSGGSLIYRSSKAALNAAMKSLSLDLKPKGIGVLILHPGWVKTDMGGRNALIHAQESVSGMRQCIENFDLEQTGSFLKYDKQSMPW